MQDLPARKYNCIELAVGNTDLLILFGQDFHFRAADWRSPPHYHLFCECHFLKGGTYRVKTESGSELLSGASVLVFPSRLRHNIDLLLTPVQKISFYVVISENQESACDTFSAYRKIFQSDRLFVWQRPGAVWEQILAEVRRPGNALGEMKLKHLFSLALLELIEQSGEPAPVQRPPLRYREEVLLKMEGFLVESFSPEATLEDLAEHLCLSPRQTNRLLRQVMGCTFQEIKNQKRLESAKLLIREGKLSMSEIAQRLGYGSYTGFHKMFRMQTGMSPEEFRSEDG